MYFSKKIRLADNAINLSFAKEPFSSRNILIFLPGGPGLSSSYFKKFIAELADHFECYDLALLDLPNHDQSIELNNLDFSITSNLIWQAIKEIHQQYKSISIFAHSVSGCLLFGSSSQKTKIENVFLCGVPYRFENSSDFLSKIATMNIKSSPPQTNSEFIGYFEQIVPLYFRDSAFYDHNEFWANGSFWKKGKLIMEQAQSVEKSLFTPQTWYNKIYLIEGDSDIVIPNSNSLLFRKKMPDLKCFVVSHAGHFPFIEQSKHIISTLLKVLELKNKTPC